jgi:hypothetical protein
MWLLKAQIIPFREMGIRIRIQTGTHIKICPKEERII